MRRLGIAGTQFHQYQPYVAGHLGFTNFTGRSFSASFLLVDTEMGSCHYTIDVLWRVLRCMAIVSANLAGSAQTRPTRFAESFSGAQFSTCM